MTSLNLLWKTSLRPMCWSSWKISNKSVSQQKNKRKLKLLLAKLMNGGLKENSNLCLGEKEKMLPLEV